MKCIDAVRRVLDDISSNREYIVDRIVNLNSVQLTEVNGIPLLTQKSEMKKRIDLYCHLRNIDRVIHMIDLSSEARENWESKVQRRLGMVLQSMLSIMRGAQNVGYTVDSFNGVFRESKEVEFIRLKVDLETPYHGVMRVYRWDGRKYSQDAYTLSELDKNYQFIVDDAESVENGILDFEEKRLTAEEISHLPPEIKERLILRKR